MLLLLLLLLGLRLAHWYSPTLPDTAVLVTVLVRGRGGDEEGGTPTAMIALTAGGMPAVAGRKGEQVGRAEHARQRCKQSHMVGYACMQAAIKAADRAGIA